MISTKPNVKKTNPNKPNSNPIFAEQSQFPRNEPKTNPIFTGFTKKSSKMTKKHQKVTKSMKKDEKIGKNDQKREIKGYARPAESQKAFFVDFSSYLLNIADVIPAKMS